MFVGISAGKLGVLKTSVPFTKDSSGRLLQRCLGKLGWSESDEFSERPVLKDCWITNIVKGRILDEKGNNRLPTLKEIEYWWPTFDREIQTVNPERILALGDVVWNTLHRKLRFEYLNRTVQAKHPRWYASHGAIKDDSPAFKSMLTDYATLLNWEKDRQQ